MRAMPAWMAERFVARGAVYHFRGGGRAFVDDGERLRTGSENRTVIHALVAIARARGWRAIVLCGSDRFRRELWLAARLSDLIVTNYRPDAPLQARLQAERARRHRRAATPPAPGPSPGASPAFSPPTSDGVASSTPRAPWPLERRSHEARSEQRRTFHGRLLDHGPAPYRHVPANGASYFVRLHTRRGEHTIWDADLERALRASVSRVGTGDEVVLRRESGEAATARAVASISSSRHAHYVIETRAFLAERGRLARVLRDASIPAQRGAHREPALVTAYLQLHVAALTARRFAHPDDRDRFVHIVRAKLVASIGRGEPVGVLAVRAPERHVRRAPPARAASAVRG